MECWKDLLVVVENQKRLVTPAVEQGQHDSLSKAFEYSKLDEKLSMTFSAGKLYFVSWLKEKLTRISFLDLQ